MQKLCGRLPLGENVLPSLEEPQALISLGPMHDWVVLQLYELGQRCTSELGQQCAGLGQRRAVELGRQSGTDDMLNLGKGL